MCIRDSNGGFAEFGRLACGVGSEPVSYTHLDVYKRQQWRFRRVRKTVVWCWVGAR
ncbi:hypothetical protein [Sphingobium sp. B2]|uniref:hypothetical protein n=1 Tax=Sphingobium sp. B2 TaxID=2583228 RepID=UPI001643E553|nr:hypothetical protein [Sphingobium sp. B2]